MVVLYVLRFNINTLLCYTVVSVLVLDIGIARGQYYWILGAFLCIVLTLINIHRASSVYSLLLYFPAV